MPKSKRRAATYPVRPLPFTLVLALGALLANACSSDAASPSPPGGAGASAAPSAGSSNAGAAAIAGAAAGGSAAAGSPGGGGTSSSGQAGAATGGSGGASGANASGGASGSAAGGSAAGGSAGGGASAPFVLKSSAFNEGEQVPLKYKCAQVNPPGENQSPPLSWGPGPAGTQSYAIVMMHVPSPEHWVLWDIPATVTSLAENIEHAAQPALPAGSKQSLANLDGFTGSGYLGPCPQAVNSPQTYQFTLYALDVATLPGLTGASSPTEAATVVRAHLVAGSQGVSLSGTQVRTP